ncbi:MAG: rhodanese-like domain-containing protein [Chloroflexota bacterium]
MSRKSNRRKRKPAPKPTNRGKREPALKPTFPLWGWILLGVVLVVAVVAVIFMQGNKPSVTGLAADINIEQAAQLREEGAFILDVREPDEWVNFHIPGSTLIPLGELPDRLSEVPTDKTIVVVCNSGNRSKPGRDILLDAGFSEVTSMNGGVTEWKSQGLPIVTGQ